MDEVVRYLEGVDQAAAWRARSRYSCFDRLERDPQIYGYTTMSGAAETCEQAVVDQLLEFRRRREELMQRDGRPAEDEFLHLAKRGRRPRIVVWAHNSHLGDARATEMMGLRGELNVGQLARERWGDDAVLVGFTTSQGTVTAASQRDGPAARMHVRPALPGSYEALFHDTELPRFLFPVRGSGHAGVLDEMRLERAIGVIYRPETERPSHWFHARMSRQFDAVIHIDTTRAVEPVEVTAPVDAEVPGTFPTGE